MWRNLMVPMVVFVTPWIVLVALVIIVTMHDWELKQLQQRIDAMEERHDLTRPNFTSQSRDHTSRPNKWGQWK